MIKRLFSRFITAVFLWTMPFITFAGPFDATVKTLENTAKTSGYPTSNVTEVTFAAFLGKLVQMVLNFIGVVFALLIIYAGFLWMTAGGDQQKVDKSKSILKNSIIGLIITLLAIFIVRFVSDILKKSL